MGPLSEKTCSEVKNILDLQIIDKSKKLDLLVYQMKKVAELSNSDFHLKFRNVSEAKTPQSLRRRFSEIVQQRGEEGVGC